MLKAKAKAKDLTFKAKAKDSKFVLEDSSVTAQDDVRLLGVTISSDLSLQRHVSNVSATSFYWLRQLRRVRQCLADVGGPPSVAA